MRNLRSRRARIKLPPEAYRELHRQVLDRDNWQCQLCGSRNNLQVHHKEFRSHSGDDSEDNLITLCPKVSRTGSSRCGREMSREKLVELAKIGRFAPQSP